jgi:hypothetical protein
MDAVDRFVKEVTLFQQWARRADDQGEQAARAGLLRIANLYLAALQLPAAPSEESADSGDVESVHDDEWNEVYGRCARLPLEYYSEVFDPLTIPPQEPVVGSLADDIADIFRDVVSGLRTFQGGHRARAIQHWSLMLSIHWGEHATGAIRALHCWLATRAPDRLTSDTRLGA